MKKTLFILFLVFFGFSNLIANAYSFSDVDGNQRYYKGIDLLTKMGIVQGNPDGTFAPDRILNRAELIKIVAYGVYRDRYLPNNTFDSYENKKCFSDLDEGAWYTKYVCYAKDMGWIVGYGDGTFQPSKNVTFVEALKITYRAMGYDYTEDNVWYKNLVIGASDKNVIPFSISGFDQSIQRDEAIDLFARLMQYNAGDLDEYLGDRKNSVVTYEVLLKGGLSQVVSGAKQPLAKTATKISKIEAGYDSITLELENFGLKSGEKYFVECIPDGAKGEASFPSEESDSNVLILKKEAEDSYLPIEPNTTYSCMAAIKGVDHKNGYFSNSVEVKTKVIPEDVIKANELSLDISGATAGINQDYQYIYIDLSIKYKNLNAFSGDYFAKCVSKYGSRTFNIYYNGATGRVPGLRANTDYQCYMYLVQDFGAEALRSNYVSVKTPARDDQIKLDKVLYGFDKAKGEKGGYAVVIFEDLSMSASKKYYAQCSSIDGSKFSSGISDKNYVNVDNLAVGKYECWGNADAKQFASERIEINISSN